MFLIRASKANREQRLKLSNKKVSVLQTEALGGQTVQDLGTLTNNQTSDALILNSSKHQNQY